MSRNGHDAGVRAEVIVVGAGVMGCAAARALADAGRDVLLVDQFRQGHGRGSSHGRTRIFRLAYPQPEWVRLAQESRAGWHELEAESGETLLELHGLLELYRDPAVSSAAALEACGAAFELLDRATTERRFGFRVPDGMTVLHQPDAGIVHADRALHAFLAGALQRGAHLLEDTRIESLDELEAEVVVVTAGPWAPKLLELDVVPTRETVVYFRLGSDRPAPSVVAEIANGHGFYALHDPDYGLKVGRHKAGPPADPDEPGAPDEAIVRACVDWARERYDLADPEPAAVDTCFYTNAPGDAFVLERRGRVVVGSACSGHGFKFAPAVGARLAELAGSIL
jgi:sarcosine oxidase